MSRHRNEPPELSEGHTFESRSKVRRIARHWQRFLLFAPILMALSGIATIVVADSIADHLGEQSLALGRQLGAFQQFAGPDTQVTWNGQRISLSAHVLPLDLPTVLSRFQTACEQSRNPAMGDHFLRAQVAAETSAFARALTLSQHREREGTAACFAGLGSAGLADIAQRARAFRDSGDLAVLGQPRYIHARALDRGTTRVLLMHAEGALPLVELLPNLNREAAGDDPIPGVRPHGARRFISLVSDGRPYGFTAYASEHFGPDAMLTDYGAQLATRGYRALPIPLHGPSVSEPALPRPEAALRRTFVRGDQAIITQATTTKDGIGLLSVVQMAVTNHTTNHMEAGFR